MPSVYIAEMEADQTSPTITYAIGDIHGHLDKLKDAHARIAHDAAGREHRIVHLGDLVDRGPESRGVIDYLMSGQAKGAPWIVLKGNHDRMFAWFLEDKPRRDHCMRSSFEWYNDRLGGLCSLASYGVTGFVDEFDDPAELARLHRAALDAVPRNHREYLLALPDRFQTDFVFFTHAGVNPNISLDDQVEDDLIWIRKPFHDHQGAYKKLIVHGHTPVKAVTHYGNRVNVDTNAGEGGPLSAIVVEERGDGVEVFELTDTGRRRIKPES